MKIGVIGPEDSITKVFNEKQILPNNIELKSYEALSLRDAVNISEQVQSEVDGILFTGQSVSGSVISKKHIYKPNLFIPHSAFSLLSLLFNEIKTSYKHLSVDVVSEEVIKEVPFNINEYKLNTLSYEVYHTEEDYIIHHEKNLKSGAQAVITTFAAVYSYFKEKNIPVFRLYTTEFDIRYTLKLLILEIEKSLYLEAQIAIQIIHFENNINTIKYESNDKLLQFEQMLNQYTRNCSGTYIRHNKSEYYIYATKKSLTSEEMLGRFFELNEHSPYKLFSGIGYGNTVYTAELNAQNAISLALKENETNVFICDKDIVFKGPFTEARNSMIEPVIDKQTLHTISLKTSLSTTYIKRIHRIIKTKNVDVFTAKEFAHYLGISERSANRVLKKLTDAGYAEIVEIIRTSKSGRPFNRTKILLNTNNS